MKKFEDSQKERQVELIRNSNVFNGDNSCVEEGEQCSHILENAENNLYASIKDDAIAYFNANSIQWQEVDNTLSSQVACTNHLFAIRNDKDAVLAMLNGVSDQFMDVLPITYGEEKCVGYIAFEVVSKHNRLNENRAVRGAFCTSIDALMHAVDRSGKKWLIPIEWKYKESYNNKDRSKGNDGATRQKCYNAFITGSEQLKSLDEYQGSIYYRDTFYQLMRQTLLAEQMIEHKDIDADYFLHINVIPKENKELLDKKCDLSGKNMESTWRDMIKCQEKYVVIDPEDLMNPIEASGNYPALINYLRTRYWKIASECK